jgi:hypothetical protein
LNNSQHFDVLNSILSIIKALPIEVTLKHIAGHQDDFMPYSTLNRQSQLNILVDKMAKEAASMAIRTNTQRRHYSLPYLNCEILTADISNNHTMISSHLTKTLRAALQRNSARQ